MNYYKDLKMTPVTKMDNLVVFIKAHIHAAKLELKKLEEYGPTCTVNESKIQGLLAIVATYEHVLGFIGES